MIIRHEQVVRAFHSLRAEEAINQLFNSIVLKVIISVPTEHSMPADNQYIIVIFTSITSISPAVLSQTKTWNELTFFLSDAKEPLFPSPAHRETWGAMW